MTATVQVIRTDGTEENHTLPKAGLLRQIYKLIGCETVDAVNLRDGRVMLVDDDGWECQEMARDYGVELVPIRARKPVNARATDFYRAVTIPNDHQIVGDVAIVNDEDFA